MPDDINTLLYRMIGGDQLAVAEILDRGATTDSPKLLVAAAVIGGAASATRIQQLLARAGKSSVTTIDRQLVAVATAHLDRADDLLDVLVREHLSEFPDSILAVWIATKHQPKRRAPANPRSSHA